MTVDITHDCIWILNADKHMHFLQSKHLQCRGLEKAKELKKKMKNILFSGCIRDVLGLVYKSRKTPVEGTLSQK